MYPNPEIFGLSLSWYNLFHWLGVLAATIFIVIYYRKQKTMNLQIVQWLGLIVTLYVCLMFGGRLVGVIETYLRTNTFPDLKIFLEDPSAGHFRWCGSLLFTILLLPKISSSILKTKTPFALLDILALAFCLLTIFTKQGCQFSGDGCYGIVTDSIFGMYYPYGIAPNILPVHPTPIYDSLFHVVFFITLLWWNNTRKKYNGQIALLYFMGASIFYIVLEIIRTNPVVFWQITLPQLVYVLVLIGSSAYYRQLNFTTFKHHQSQ